MSSVIISRSPHLSFSATSRASAGVNSRSSSDLIPELASGALQWYRTHAMLVFAVTLIAAFTVETARQMWKRRNVDLTSTTTSVVSAGSFLLVKTAFGKLVMLSLSLWIYENHRMTTLNVANPLVWLGVFLLRDAIYYWEHRAEHSVRLLWASHMVHHSPTTIGFTTAIRVPWMEALYKPWLGLWVPLIGFHPLAFVTLDVLAATIGQLQHTTACRKRTILDAVFVTPSAHRVHHGSNPQYIDRNFGAVLIVWDRLFGTYTPETVTPVYGIGTKSAITSPSEALVGGYPKLFAAARQVVGETGSLRTGASYLVAPPA